MSIKTFIHKYQPADQPGMPTLLLLHGTGGDENALLDVAKYVMPHAGLLSLRGNVPENGNPRFFRRFAEGVLDVEDQIFRTHELAKFVNAAAQEYSFDIRTLIAVGYSNGANIAASLLLLHPESLARAVLFRAVWSFDPDPLPDLSEKHVLIVAGTADPIMPRSQVERLAGVFRTAHASLTLNWQRADHGLTYADLNAARDWLSSDAKESPQLEDRVP